MYVELCVFQKQYTVYRAVVKFSNLRVLISKKRLSISLSGLFSETPKSGDAKTPPAPPFMTALVYIAQPSQLLYIQYIKSLMAHKYNWSQDKSIIYIWKAHYNNFYPTLYNHQQFHLQQLFQTTWVVVFDSQETPRTSEVGITFCSSAQRTQKLISPTYTKNKNQHCRHSITLSHQNLTQVSSNLR